MTNSIPLDEEKNNEDAEAGTTPPAPENDGAVSEESSGENGPRAKDDAGTGEPTPDPQDNAPAKEQGTLFQNLGTPLAIIVAGAMIAGALYFSSGAAPRGGRADLGSAPQQPSTDTGSSAAQPQDSAVAPSVDDDPFLGNPQAPVTIIEFSDFQCPFCRRSFSEVLPQLKTAYIATGKARLVYRDFPLPFHDGARPAAEGAECADDQGKFWEMHDAIFEEQGKQGSGTVQFGADDVKQWAERIGLNMEQFNACFDSGKYKAEVAKDYADGQQAGVNGTPTFFVNGKEIVGAQPFSEFEKLIEAELQ